MKKVTKIVTALTLAGALTAGGTLSSLACCGVYVGKDVSTTGKAYFGRSEDIGNYYNKIFTVHPAEDHEPGSMYPTLQNFTMPYPSHTYRYTLCKDSPLMENEPVNNDETFAEVGTNENGVSATMTTTIGTNKTARAADPYVQAINPETGSAGISEIAMGTAILSQATSARNACEIFADIIDTYGAYESNSVMFSDASEVWYFENHAGHQYAAIKMPDDKVSVMPNMSLLDTIDVNDTENVIASPGLVSLAKEGGFLVTGADGKIDVGKTWGNNANDGWGQQTRYYQGVYYFNQAEAEKYAIDKDNRRISGEYPLLFDPAGKVSPFEAIRFLGTQGEGSKLDSTKDGGIYPVGNPNQAECHIFETDASLPSQLTTEWLTMASGDFGLFLPFYGALLTETADIYHDEAIDETWKGSYPDSDSMYWTVCELENICRSDRTKYGTKVKEYLEKYQQSLIDQKVAVDADMAKVYAYSPDLAEEKATALGKAVSTEAYNNLRSVLTELKLYQQSGAEGEFVPTALTENKMPHYSFAIVGGTGLPTPADPSSNSSPENASSENDASSGSSSESSAPKASASDSSTDTANAPKTGDITGAGLVAAAVAAAGAALALRKRKS